jgi:putative tricarboxylic transport membrane protein
VRHFEEDGSMSLLPLRQDFVGGIAVIVVAAYAFWQGKDLAMGTLGGMGPGMLPKSLAVLLGLLGALLAVNALRDRGPRLSRLSIRGPLFVLGAIAAFAVSVRPGGLLIAGPLAMFIAACGSQESRWGETLVYGTLMTAFCIGLFKFALGLPIPLAPWLLQY